MSILQELLDAIYKEDLTTSAALARRLNVSQGLIELMLADLEQKGYLRVVTGDCHSCSGCSKSTGCSDRATLLK